MDPRRIRIAVTEERARGSHPRLLLLKTRRRGAPQRRRRPWLGFRRRPPSPRSVDPHGDAEDFAYAFSRRGRGKEQEREEARGNLTGGVCCLCVVLWLPTLGDDVSLGRLGRRVRLQEVSYLRRGDLRWAEPLGPFSI